MKDKSKIRVRMATINALGHSHTRPGGNKAGRGWLQATRRTILLILIINARGYGIVGLQEFQALQQRVFRRRTSLWGCHDIKDNAVVWRRPVWKCLDRGHLTIPYFDGKPKPMPWVILERRALRKSKRKRIAYISTHNPASVRGPAEHWRFEGFRAENRWVEKMLGPDLDLDAVFVVGDKNDRANDYLPFVRKTGGKHSHVPDIWGIDWIVGWGDVEWVEDKCYTFETPRVDKTTDHPVTQAVAIIG